MDLRRPRRGEWIAGLAGVVLVVAPFLDWYAVEGATFLGRGPAGSAPSARDVSGWQAFALLDVLLVLVGAVAAALPLIAAWQRTPAIPIALDSLTTLLGIVALVLVAFRVVDVPEQGLAEAVFGGSAVAVDSTSRLAGIYVALAGCVGVVLGGAWAMRDEGLGRGGARWEPGEESPVAVTTLPAPKTRSESPGG